MIEQAGGFLLGYGFGSIPFGLLIAALAGQGDIRKIGSGNIGATNVLRTGSKALAVLTLLADMAKGFLPVLIAARWGLDAALAAAMGAFLGHLFPGWLKFRGGKGVATYIGILFALYWPAGVIFIGVWIMTAFLSRISSLSALVASGVMPFVPALASDKMPAMADRTALTTVFLIISLLIFLAHRQNIFRLVTRSEPKIGAGSTNGQDR
jgi:glycerol-3-phosphate acyltransferase PlsY